MAASAKTEGDIQNRTSDLESATPIPFGHQFWGKNSGVKFRPKFQKNAKRGTIGNFLVSGQKTHFRHFWTDSLPLWSLGVFGVAEFKFEVKNDLGQSGPRPERPQFWGRQGVPCPTPKWPLAPKRKEIFKIGLQIWNQRPRFLSDTNFGGKIRG